MNRISLWASAERMMKFVKKKTKTKGNLIKRSGAVSPSIFGRHPLLEAGVSVPNICLTERRKKTGRP